MSCLWFERIVIGCRVSDLILPPILSYFSSSENFYGILRATKCLMDAQLRCDVTDHDWCHLNFITILNPWYWAGLGHWDQGYQSACLNVIYPPLQMVMNYHHCTEAWPENEKCWQNIKLHHCEDQAKTENPKLILCKPFKIH